MSAINELIRRLDKYPHIKYEAEKDSISIPPINDQGFDITLSEENNGYVVWFGNYHDQFDSVENILDLIYLGLSGRCRLREISRGKMPYKWIIEINQNGEWQPSLMTGLLIYPFFLKKKEKVYQNHHQL